MAISECGKICEEAGRLTALLNPRKRDKEGKRGGKGGLGWRGWAGLVWKREMCHWELGLKLGDLERRGEKTSCLLLYDRTLEGRTKRFEAE